MAVFGDIEGYVYRDRDIEISRWGNVLNETSLVEFAYISTGVLVQGTFHFHTCTCFV